MGLDQYLYAEKYLSVFDADDRALANKLHGAIGLKPLSHSDFAAIDQYPRINTVKILVLQWRKDYIIDDFIGDKIEKDNGGYYGIDKGILVELVAHLKEEAEKLAPDCVARQRLEQDVEDLQIVIDDPYYEDMDFYYTSNW